ncbi:HAD hydrolase family protein [Christensenellaceae bacterium OttesenSCG-928-K19]|nr:HAD hydrolase family protein [Christensenellaceae bacterium OttesenSCG-928-K19]
MGEAKRYIPPVGMRIVKTAIAVGLSVFLSGVRPDGMAIYSAIAAVICMQQSDAHSVKTGIARIVNTLIAGGFGLVVLLLMQEFEVLREEPFHAILLACFVVPVIYITVVLKRTDSTGMICIVFLAITFNQGNMPPLEFMYNRMLDTIIGILVSLLVNGLWVKRKRNTDVLFVTSFDGTLAAGDGKLTNFTRVNLNRLLEKKAAITIATNRTPSTLVPQLAGISFSLPFIVMNGAAVFDASKRTYPYQVPIPADTVQLLVNACAGEKAQCYRYAIEHNELHVYCVEPVNAYEEKHHEVVRRREHHSYVHGVQPEDADCLFLFFGGEPGHIEKLEQAIRALPCAQQLNIVRRDNMYHEGFANIEVTNRLASKETAVQWMMERYGFVDYIAFGQGQADVKLLAGAKRGYCMEGSVPEVRALHLPPAGSNSRDSVVKKISTLFYDGRLMEEEKAD